MRKNYSTGAPWESVVGYSRAVQVGNQMEVSGTVAVGDDGHVMAPGDYYGQTQFILSRIGQVLASAGFTLADVVRTRIYTRDIRQWKAIGQAHGEVFGQVRPATSMVEVSALIGPEYLVEIEVTAVKSVASPQLV